MSMRRKFNGQEVRRLITSVALEDVKALDALLKQTRRVHPARGCRSEFVRLAIAEKLVRDSATLIR